MFDESCVRVAYPKEGRKYNFLKYDSSRYRWLTSPLHIEAAERRLRGSGGGGCGLGGAG